MAARHARITAQLGNQTRPISSLSISHGFDLDQAGIPGLDGQVWWDEEQPTTVPAIPTDAAWDRAVGESLRIDWSDEQGTVRVATTRLDASAGDGLGGVSTALTDWTSRLSTEIEIRPVAATRARNTGLAGSVKRRMNLVPTWLTVEALRQAGWNTCQAMQASAVAYHQMGGSATASPDPDSTYLPMGDVRQCYRLNAYGDVDVTQAPGVTQGDDMPVMRNLYLLAQTRTRRRSNVEHWQMTQDLGVRSPAADDIGRSTLRPLQSSAGAGFRLDWDQNNVRAQRVNTNGTVATLATWPRGATMRWSVVIRANGTAAVYNDLAGATPVAQLTGTGVTALPTGSGEASYLLEWPGRASAFQLTRSDSPFLVTQAVGARVHRHAYSGRWIAGFDYVAQRAAGDFLAHQARAQVGWRGIGLVQWVDEDGRLINTDFYSLASGPIEHVLDTIADDENALDSAAWSAAASGPWRSVTVTARRPNVLLRDHPTLLLGEGSRETVPRGERLEQFIHPAPDQAWLSIDTSMYLAGHPYPQPTNKEYDNQHGTFGGGHKVDEDGQPAGWITINDVVEWSLNANGEVRGALTVLDPATVLVSGTVNTPVGLSMSTMPSPASSGLPEHRKSQALAQIRSTELMEFDEYAITVPVTGDGRHQGYTHDLGMFVTNPTEMQYAADELAASITDPALIYTARVANNPRVRVGQKVALRHRYATGWTRTVVGVVNRRRINLGTSSEDVMTLEVVRTSDSITAPADPLPIPDPTPPADAPPLPPQPQPDPDPPIDPADPPVTPAPGKPSTPAVSVDVNRLHVAWDGLLADGESAIDESFGALEVAVATHAAPGEGDVVGRADLDPGDGWHRFTHGPVPLGTTWHVRTRILNVWGTPGPWSDQVVVEVPPLVDPIQFEDALTRILEAEEGLDDLADQLAAGGHALPDPEFTDPAQWDVPAGSTFRTDLTDHPYGRTTGLTIPAGANTPGAAATLPVEPGQRWWAAVLVRAESSTTSVATGGLEVEWVTETGSQVGVEWVDARPLRDFPVGDWVLLSGYAIAPEGAAGVRLRVRRTSGNAPAWTLASARLLRASGGIADPVVLAGFIGALKIDVGQLVVTEGATINEAVILKLAADLAEFMEVRFENAVGGVLNVLAELTVNVGQDRVVIGTPAGGIGYLTPVGEASNPTYQQVSGFGRDLHLVSPEGEIYGIDRRGELGVDAASIAQDPVIAGTPLLGTLATRADEVTLDTDLGHLDALPFASNYAALRRGTADYPWNSGGEKVVMEVTREQQAGRGVELFVAGKVRFQTTNALDAFRVRVRKTEVNLPTTVQPPRPMTSSPLFGSDADQIFTMTGHAPFATSMGLYAPSRSELARWLVTVESIGRAAEPFRVEDMRMIFRDLGPMHEVALDVVDRVSYDAQPTPPVVTPKKRYTSRWFANSIRRAQGSNVTPTGDRAGQALQGWTSGMVGDPFHSILGFTGSAHYGEVGRSISNVLAGVSTSDIERVRLRVSQVGGYSSVPPRVGIQSSSTAIPTINQTLDAMSPGGTRYHILSSTFRSSLNAGQRYITFGPHTKTNQSYAAYHGTSGGNSRRVELEITYRRR